MNEIGLCLVAVLVVNIAFGLPVTKNEAKDDENKDENHNKEDVAVRKYKLFIIIYCYISA